MESKSSPEPARRAFESRTGVFGVDAQGYVMRHRRICARFPVRVSVTLRLGVGVDLTNALSTCTVCSGVKSSTKSDMLSAIADASPEVSGGEGFGELRFLSFDCFGGGCGDLG